ncbi:MAG: hypothetical protein JWM81_774 [Candidatus Saccharibacteria bacterium]|nr:hypothetical protein [Candidatus Saccharibacteria bacterium]
MATPKKYFHDHLVLLLLSVNVFLALAAVVSVLLRLVSSQGGGYIIQFRPTLGIGAYQSGSVFELISFAGFAILVAVAHGLLSMRAYHIRRQLALAILSLGILLLLLAIIVSNSLLALR